MISVEQTEKEFDFFFKNIGFERISDDVGPSPVFQNADYIHKTKNIIVELKVLFKEQFPEGGFIQPLNAIIFKPKSLDDRGLGQYLFSLPERNRNGTIDNISEPIRRILKKANKQLRESRGHYFKNAPSSGYVILAQTGLESLSPEVTGHVVRNSLVGEFSSIDGVIVCTPHFRTRNPFTLEINPECVSITKDVIPNLKSQCVELAENWVLHFENGGFTRI